MSSPSDVLVRPYRLHVVEDANEALEFSRWLQERQNPKAVLGFSADETHMGFADQDEGWIIPSAQDDLAGQVACAAVASAFSTIQAPQLVVRLMRETNPLRTIAPDVGQHIIGELEALSYTIGRGPLVESVRMNVADLAYDTYICHLQWAKDAPKFYEQVAVPLALHTHHQETYETPWRITYEDLYLRVVAHYTRDPVLVKAFMDGEDPIPHVQDQCQFESAKYTYAMLVLASLNFDSDYFKQNCQYWFEDLATNHQVLEGATSQEINYKQIEEDSTTITKYMPTLRLGVSQTIEYWLRNKGAQTRFGRILPWTNDPAAALDHQFSGSVLDLLDVLTVAIINGSEQISVTSVFPMHPLERVIRIKGTTGGSQEEILPILKGVAPLRDPLSVPLSPVVIWGE